MTENPLLCKINYYPSDQSTLSSVTVVGINDNKIKNPSRVTPTPLQALKIELWEIFMKPVSWASTTSLLREREGKRQAYGRYLIKVRMNINVEKLIQKSLFISTKSETI